MNKQYTHQQGLSLVEILVVVMIMVILGFIIFIAIDPVEIRQKARDQKRITDLGLLSSAIERYIVDHNNLPPDATNTTRASNVATSSSKGSSSGGGWIPVDLSDYIDNLPVDPKNTGTSIYRYRRSGSTYKLDAKLEYYTDKMVNTKDGGNSSCHYETGSGLTTITLSGACP